MHCDLIGYWPNKPGILLTGPKLWNYLSIDVKKIEPFSSFRQHIKNSVIDGYNTNIVSLCFTTLLFLTIIYRSGGE